MIQDDRLTKLANKRKSMRRIAPHRSQTLTYFIKSALIVVALFVISQIAPGCPAAILAPICIVYAILSTIGALHFTVINRLHRQKKLAAGGNLSRLNRKWTITFGILFVLSLVSAFLFVLESPKWNTAEWVLVCCAVPIYYIIYLIAQHYLSREYAPRFDRAKAIWLSFLLVGLVLCLLYALFALFLPAHDYASLAEAFGATRAPFEYSPSAIMIEIDQFSSFTDGLVIYGIAKVSSGSSIIALVFQLIIFGSVIFGLANLFNFSLLTNQEIADEFRLLKTDDAPNTNEGILKRYLVIAAVLSLVFFVLFLTFDSWAEHERATEEHTAIESFIETEKEHLIFAVDNADEKHLIYEKVSDEYGQKRDEIKAEYRMKIDPLLHTYYDTCREKIDSYLDGREGVFGGIVQFIISLSPDNQKNHFRDSLTNDTNKADIENTYKEYRERITDLNKEFREALQAATSELPQDKQFTSEELEMFSYRFAATNKELNLWTALDDLQKDSEIYNALFSTNNYNREAAKQAAKTIINESENNALGLI